MRNKRRRSAGLAGPASTFKIHSIHGNYTRKTGQDTIFNRDLLPTPARYYSIEFPGLKIKSEWVKVICPFHDDHNPSLSINMVGGYFKCHACGSKGCDLLAFQCLRHNQSFQEAVSTLSAWRRS